MDILKLALSILILPALLLYVGSSVLYSQNNKVFNRDKEEQPVQIFFNGNFADSVENNYDFFILSFCDEDEIGIITSNTNREVVFCGDPPITITKEGYVFVGRRLFSYIGEQAAFCIIASATASTQADPQTIRIKDN